MIKIIHRDVYENGRILPTELLIRFAPNPRVSNEIHEWRVSEDDLLSLKESLNKLDLTKE